MQNWKQTKKLRCGRLLLKTQLRVNLLREGEGEGDEGEGPNRENVRDKKG